MKTADRLVRGSAARTIATVLNMAVAFFLMPFLVKHLGEHWFGVWVLVSGIADQYHVLDLGLVTAVSRFTARYLAKGKIDSINEVVNTSLGLYLILAAGVLLIALIIAGVAGIFIENPQDLTVVRTVIVLQGLAMAFGFPLNALAGVPRAMLRYDLISYLGISRLLIRTALIIAVVSAGYGLVAIAVVVLATNLYFNVGTYLLAKYLLPQLRFGMSLFKRERIRSLFDYSVWSFLSGISDRLRLTVDSFVIGGMKSASLVTHYTIGSRLSDYLADFIYRATDLATPVFTRYHAQENFSEIRGKLLLLSKLNAVLASFGAGLVIIVGHSFIARWMGPAFLDAYPVLVVLVIARATEIVQQPAKQVLFAVARHKFYALSNICEGLTNLVLSLLLIGKYGLIGVAMATAVPMLVNRLVILPLYTFKVTDMRGSTYYGALARPFLLSGLYLGGYYFLVRDLLLVPRYTSVALVALLAIPLYAALAYWLVLGRDERDLIASLISGRTRPGRNGPRD